MSKVICDVCGTAYPETNTVCPICGSAKQSGEQTAAGNSPDAEQAASYTYVKGGRFSKRNVRRRNTGKTVKTQEAVVTASEYGSENEEDEKVNKGLVAIVIVLLLAIVAVLLYIGFKIFLPKVNIENKPDPTPTANVDPTPTGEPDPTEAPTDADVPCTGLTLSMENLSFTAIGGEYALQATPAPNNTTDTVTFASANDAVATVSADGVVRAVGFGETTITVTCGDVVKYCKVTCMSNFTFAFRWAEYNENTNKYDVTLNVGYSWKAYKDDLTVAPTDITWITDDPSICKIENGIVTPLAAGTTEIHAKYGGKTFTCIVRCKAVEVPDQGGTEVDPSAPSDTQFSFRWAEYDANSGKWDVTLKVGTTWPAYENGFDPASITWSVADTSLCTVENGVVTPLQPGITELTAVYNGVTYTCIIRIKAV